MLTLFFSVALLAACGGDGGGATGPGGGSGSTSGTSVTAATVAVVSGSGQTGTPGSALAAPLVVRVTTTNGRPVSGATVVFQITSGGGTLSPTSAVTDANGQASTQLTLDASSSAVQVTATVQGTALSTTLSASASTLGTPSVTCAPGSATALAPGQAINVTGTSICLAGAAGADFVLIPFNSATDYHSAAGITVRPSGVDPISTTLASRAAMPNATAPNATAPNAVTAGDFRTAFERHLRESRAALLPPLIPAARSWYAARNSSTLRRSVIPRNVQVGALVQLNTANEKSDDPCTGPVVHTGRVVAVSTRAIVVADTMNPTGGFTSADYQSIAVTFDTLVDAVDRKNFGDPTDIDNNGHVVLFYTSAVNALTPRNSDSYVGGFFDSRDLFPTRTSNGLPGCASSNTGELFYLLVPDPTGLVNGNKFSKSFVTNVTISTVAHEYQHLINSSRRVYVNTQAEAFEEPWLDEGLSHVAEELLFYARAGLGPGRNIDGPTISSSPVITNAFRDDGIANFDRLTEYLINPTRNSPYADNDSLATRGAAWSFLRYAADQVQPTAQETLWQRIVNSNASGMANLQQVFDGGLTALFRDWGTMLALDDVPGADARYQMKSWNLRSVYDLPGVAGAYPLRTTALTSGRTTAVTLSGGTGAYLRFGVAAGNTGALAWNALPAGVSLTLVRLH